MKKKIIIGIIAILIIGGGFYYYGLRPAIVRNKCDSEAYSKMYGVWGNNKEISPVIYSEYYELIYRHCLRNKGVKE